MGRSAFLRPLPNPLPQAGEGNGSTLPLQGGEGRGEGVGAILQPRPRKQASGWCRRQRGLGYIELIISLVVIAVSVSGVLLLVNQNASHSADPLIQRQALAIAESYLEEIRLKAYLDPDSAAVCPAPEASRADYDNVCDYAGLSDSGAQDQSGTAISGLSAYSVQVTVDQSATLHTLSGSGAVLKIMVNVSHDSGIAVALAAYRTDY